MLPPEAGGIHGSGWRPVLLFIHWHAPPSHTPQGHGYARSIGAGPRISYDTITAAMHWLLVIVRTLHGRAASGRKRRGAEVGRVAELFGVSASMVYRALASVRHPKGCDAPTGFGRAPRHVGLRVSSAQGPRAGGGSL